MDAETNEAECQGKQIERFEVARTSSLMCACMSSEMQSFKSDQDK